MSPKNTLSCRKKVLDTGTRRNGTVPRLKSQPTCQRALWISGHCCGHRNQGDWELLGCLTKITWRTHNTSRRSRVPLGNSSSTTGQATSLSRQSSVGRGSGCQGSDQKAQMWFNLVHTRVLAQHAHNGICDSQCFWTASDLACRRDMALLELPPLSNSFQTMQTNRFILCWPEPFCRLWCWVRINTLSTSLPPGLVYLR